MKLIPVFILSLLSFHLLAEEKEEEHKSDRKANTVVLDETSIQNLGIETVEAEEIDFEETVFTLGKIEVMPGKKGVISSRIAGRIKTLSAEPDQRCEKGQELVWIESRQPGDPPPVVPLEAPIGGTIGKVNVAVGQPVEPGDSLFEIFDLTTVEASAAVPEHLAGKLSKGQKAIIRLQAFPGEEIEAEMAHLAVEADSSAGTINAAFHLPNPDMKLRPGMRAEFSIVIGKREGIMSIPREAVQGDPSNRFVYIKDYELKHAFMKVPVGVGAQNDRFVEILRGLNPGDEVVTKGAYSLAFAGKGSVSLKEALDAAHGHPHNEDGTEMTKEQLAAQQAGNQGQGSSQGAFDAPLTKLFAATTGVLFIALIAVGFSRNQPQEDSADA